MNSPLAARLPFEMLDRIGHVSLFARDSSFLQRGVEHFPRWADERLARAIFLIARLLADEHHGGICWTFSEDGLGGVAIKRASLAFGGRFCERGQFDFSRQEISRGTGGWTFGICGRWSLHRRTSNCVC
ncbi:MAG TPA: hypothetical protein VFW23_06605, partial [Tepidisphaeraceae bacterium]|nr:hypothetical protein [Tepidisphaeraceae bacterium]